MKRSREIISWKSMALVWVILTQFSLASSQEIVFEHFSSSNGLSNNLIRDIIQDREGYLWFATSGGLNRFDGHFFDIYRPVVGDTMSLSDSRLTELFLDDRGFVWVRSSLGNIHRIDPVSNLVLNLKELGLMPEGSIALGEQVSEWGDIWITMDQGLLRIYYPDEDSDVFTSVLYTDENILPDNTVNFVLSSDRKTNWIGTNDGLVRLYNPEEGPDEVRSRAYYANEGIAFLSVYEIESEVYFGTGSGELIIYDTDEGTFRTDENINELIRGNISVISQNQEGNILFGIDNGDVMYYDPQLEEYRLFESRRTASLDADIISEVFTDSYGLFWLITEKRGLFQFDPRTMKFKYFGLNFENRIFLGEPDKQVLLEDSNRDLWAGINGGGLFLFDRQRNEFRQFIHDPGNISSISSDIVLSLFEDRSNNLWIGTSYGGINKVSLREKQFRRISLVPEPETSFDNFVRSVATDPLGNVYVGSKAGKIFIYRDGKKIGTVPDDLYDPGKFPATNIYCMYFDQDHNLWIGAKGNGIFIFKSFLTYFTNLKHKNIEVLHLESDPGVENSLSSNNVYSIVEDVHGQYWIGHLSGGLDMLTDPFSDPKFRNFTSGTQGGEDIVSDEVRYLYIDHNQNLWVATSEGISILESDYLLSGHKQFINLQPSLSDTLSLSGKVVYQIKEAQNNDILVAMLEGGLNRLRAEDFEKRNFRWIHHTSHLLSQNVYSVEEDHRGNIWMGTDNGLYRLDSENEEVEEFRIQNLYLPLTFSESCSGKTRRFEMVFGSNDGFIVFHPDSIHKDSTQYPLRFSSLEINGEQIRSQSSAILDRSIETQEKIELDHTENNITLYFSVLDYNEPDAIQYSYFLEGFDKMWSKASNANYASYRQLAPGDYILHVKGTNSSGIYMDDEASLAITVHPPFWRSARGHLLIALIAVLLAAAVLLIIYRQIFIQNRLKVENSITERRIEYYTNISHEFKTPLSLILNPADEIISSMKSTEFARQKGVEIKKNATYLKRLIEQILDFRKLREGNMQLQVSQLDLMDFFREIYLVFMPLAQKMNINFKLDATTEEFLGYADVRQLEKVVFNLLSNAFRFTPSGKTVNLKVSASDNWKRITIDVEDQGAGIDEEELPRIFDRFYMSKGSTGIGLFFTKELVFLHKGEIEAFNKNGGGSVFRFSIPVDRASYSDGEISMTPRSGASFNIHSIEEIETIIFDSEAEREQQHKADHMETILIVEDNPDLQKYLATELSRKYRIIKADDGERGLALVLEKLPDLVLSDVKLPKMDGYELTRQVKANFNTAHVPVILLTAESSDEDKILGLESGADDQVTKPFNLAYLMKKIEHTILQRKKLLDRFDSIPREEAPVREDDNGDGRFITDVQQIISSNLSNQELNVEFLVDELGISRTLFFKKLRSTSGFSPNEYIRKERMKEAARMLSKTNKTINEIAYSVGYNDSNYFGKSFKKYYGTTPSEYKVSNGRNDLA